MHTIDTADWTQGVWLVILLHQKQKENEQLIQVKHPQKGSRSTSHDEWILQDHSLKFENSPWRPGVKPLLILFFFQLCSPYILCSVRWKWKIQMHSLGNLPPLLLCYSSLTLNSYLLSLFNSGSQRNTSGWIQFNKHLRSTCLGARTSGSSNVKTYPRNSQSTEVDRHLKRSSVSLGVRTGVLWNTEEGVMTDSAPWRWV